MTPTNMNAIGTSTAPVFPTAPTRGTVWSRAARATALPDRWAIVGIQGGRTVFRKWTAFIPDYLAATVSLMIGDDCAAGSSIVDPDALARRFAEATRVEWRRRSVHRISPRILAGKRRRSVDCDRRRLDDDSGPKRRRLERCSSHHLPTASRSCRKEFRRTPPPRPAPVRPRRRTRSRHG